MNVELIYDVECPNVADARGVLLKAFAQAGAEAHWVEWERSSGDSPGYTRRYGSPTILVDGCDVAGASPGAGHSCCRLYWDERGRAGGVPAVGSIISALVSSGVGSGESQSVSGSGGWKSSVATIPGIAIAFLPNLACPACWPAYAGLLGSMGLGFLIEARYLAPVTTVLLVLAIGALAYRARARRGYGPFVVGAVAGAVFFAGKFYLDSDLAVYVGIGGLIAASLWNAWPGGYGAGCSRRVEWRSSNPIE